eukprot:scaffold776_cov347-Pavlova_lutheri.AAC.92
MQARGQGLSFRAPFFCNIQEIFQHVHVHSGPLQLFDRPFSRTFERVSHSQYDSFHATSHEFFHLGPVSSTDARFQVQVGGRSSSGFTCGSDRFCRCTQGPLSPLMGLGEHTSVSTDQHASGVWVRRRMSSGSAGQCGRFRQPFQVFGPPPSFPASCGLPIASALHVSRLSHPKGPCHGHAHVFHVSFPTSECAPPHT